MSDVTPAEKAAEALARIIGNASDFRHGDTVAENVVRGIARDAREALAALRSPPADAQTLVGVEAELTTYAAQLRRMMEQTSFSADTHVRVSDPDYLAALLERSAADMARVMGERDEVRGRVAKLEERLEIDHYYRFPKKGEDADEQGFVRVETTADERKTFIDGIECRDATIALLEGDAERLRARAEAAEKEAAALREALCNAHKRCRHDMGMDMEHGPVGCEMGCGCACVGEFATLLYQHLPAERESDHGR